ncbi:MAG: hypothetical protein WBN23_16430 [Woeseia sp.]
MKRSNVPQASIAKPALLAAGSVCILLANPSTAVELGAIAIESSLGQPLRASIAYALGPNETINDQCVYLNAVSPAAGLPSVSRAAATINGQRIVLRGDVPLREPMMTLELAVNCPYTAKLKREYLLLLNPASATDSVADSAIPQPARELAPIFDARRPVNTFVAPQRATTRRPSAPVSASAPIASGSEYRVRVGDTLSEIAARVPDRKLGLWNAVNRIYEANPQAFLNNNIDRLIAGTTLQIPASVTGGQRSTTASTASRAATGSSSNRARAYQGAAEGPRGTPAETTTLQPPATAPAAAAEGTEARIAPVATPAPAVTAPDTSSNADDSIIGEGQRSSASSAAPQATVVIPDTRIQQQQAVPIAVADNDSVASSWLVWLGGTGIALFLALLLFGRRLRDKLGGADEQAADLDETQISDAVHRHLEEPGVIEVTETFGPAMGLQIESALSSGADFDTGDDVDVALDYSFASSGEHSEELDFIVEGDDTHDAELPTRVMPAAAEITSQEEDDYDMSMVLDVTKQDFQAPDHTIEELQATEVTASTELTVPVQTGSRDLTSEFDYRILEQDYEDELTATQALSREVEEAARDLQKRLADIEPDTSQISMAQDLELTAEITAEMPQRALAQDAQDTVEMPRDQNVDEFDETDLTEALAASMDELNLDIDDDDETAVLGLDATKNQRQSKAG